MGSHLHAHGPRDQLRWLSRRPGCIGPGRRRPVSWDQLHHLNVVPAVRVRVSDGKCLSPTNKLGYSPQVCGLTVPKALFYSAATASGAFGGFLARAIVEMDGVGGKAGWSWIFIIEGLITVVGGKLVVQRLLSAGLTPPKKPSELSFYSTMILRARSSSARTKRSR